MKTLCDIFTNGWVLPGLAIFGGSLALLWRKLALGPEGALGGIIFGIAFPLIAWVTTLGTRRLPVPARRSAGEMALLFACLVLVTLYLFWGATIANALVPPDWLASPRGNFLITLGRKPSCSWQFHSCFSEASTECHCRALRRRHFLRDRLGADEEPVRGDVHPRCDRSAAEFQTLRLNLVYLGGNDAG